MPITKMFTIMMKLMMRPTQLIKLLWRLKVKIRMILMMNPNRVVKQLKKLKKNISLKLVPKMLNKEQNKKSELVTSILTENNSPSEKLLLRKEIGLLTKVVSSPS